MAASWGHHDQPLTAVERADRARRIAETKASGATWETVAAMFGVSEKTARRAAKAHAEGTARPPAPNGTLKKAMRAGRYAGERTRPAAGLAESEDQERPPAPKQMPTFYEFAAEWLATRRTERGLDEQGRDRKAGQRTRSDVDICWRLNKHLLPFFARIPLDEIDVRMVDQFKASKAMEGVLSPGSINKMIDSLQMLLEVAVEYEVISRNPAKGKRRRLPVPKKHRSYLARSEHIEALLKAAGGLDEDGRADPWRRAFLAILVFTGCRISEAIDLRWRDVDLANGRLKVAGTKTQAADRTVEMLPVLRDELSTYAAARPGRARNERVFTTITGGRLCPSNFRDRVLRDAIAVANATLEEDGNHPLPEGLTPHSLRRTFASVLVALGRDLAVIMRQMGHTTPHMTLSIYTGVMDWSDGEREQLRALVEGKLDVEYSGHRTRAARRGP